MVTNPHSIVARWRKHFSQLFNVHRVEDIRQTEIHPEEPLMSELSAFEVKMASEELKICKSPGIDQIPAELIMTEGRKIHSEIHKLINPAWNKEELPEDWKQLITVPIYKGNKKDCNKYRGISLLSTTYKTLTNILLSRLTPYAEEIIGDHQCGFWCNWSTTDHIFYIHQIFEKKWE